eukprot:TRINITY_DN12652_c0_g1_i1.p1 TRINITY_DN12652_c0_g1~~TRINITY_DN12652_c0_g1_i1.p1  ORF type:complete len:103 (-),score=8.22 TRINITY_DN12652_c0_g1_i1:66-374(-)
MSVYISFRRTHTFGTSSPSITIIDHNTPLPAASRLASPLPFNPLRFIWSPSQCRRIFCFAGMSVLHDVMAPIVRLLLTVPTLIDQPFPLAPPSTPQLISACV